MADEVAEFHEAVADLEDAYRRGIRSFAKWFVASWKITPEQWRHDFAGELPGGEEWFAGHNAGVEGALVAVDHFLDEYLNR